MRLDKEGILGREDAEPYIQAYLNECRKHDQTTFKVHDTSKQMRILSQKGRYGRYEC